MSVIEGAGLAAATAYLAWTALRTALTLRGARAVTERTRAPETGSRGAESPLVTVLQPILGGDPALERVLGEALSLGPAWARYLWLVDADDPVGRAIAERLAVGDPRVAVRSSPPPGPEVNPKVLKLERALQHVATPFTAVMDDDTLAGAEHFTAALDALGAFAAPARADLYTGLPSYDAASPRQAGLGGALLAAFVNDGAATVYLGLQSRTAPRTLNGMFYVARTESLRTWQAFSSIRCCLCDDLALARHVRAQGGRILQGALALRLHTSLDGWAGYMRQMHRWHLFARVLLRSEPLHVRAPLVVGLAFPPLLLWVVLVAAPASATALAAASLTLLLRQGALGWMRRQTLQHRPGPAVHVVPWVSVLAELLQPLHALHALVLPTVRWRTRRIRVQSDGRFHSLAGEPHR